MAVGTGLQFDSLWDQKETGFDQMSGMDVYNFLHMVSSAGRINSYPACLGKEVDLMEMDEMENWWKWLEIKSNLDDFVTKHLTRTRTQSEEF